MKIKKIGLCYDLVLMTRCSLKTTPMCLVQVSMLKTLPIQKLFLINDSTITHE